MNLWHQRLITSLPDARSAGVRKFHQLGGLHREICIMRGRGWCMEHFMINYAWWYPYEYLVAYHWLVMLELCSRGYNVDQNYFIGWFRGYGCHPWPTEDIDEDLVRKTHERALNGEMIYREHDDHLLRWCLKNLANKGIVLDAAPAVHNGPDWNPLNPVERRAHGLPGGT